MSDTNTVYTAARTPQIGVIQIGTIQILTHRSVHAAPTPEFSDIPKL